MSTQSKLQMMAWIMVSIGLFFLVIEILKEIGREAAQRVNPQIGRDIGSKILDADVPKLSEGDQVIVKGLQKLHKGKATWRMLNEERARLYFLKNRL